MDSDELKTLRRIEALLTAMTRAALFEKLREIRSDKALRLLYERTGQHSVKELAKATKFSVGKISGIWREWEDKGLLIKDGKSFRKVV